MKLAALPAVLRRRQALGALGALALPVAAAAAPAGQPAQPGAVQRDRRLAFPRDHGAHLAARTEWWYATGWLGTPEAPRWGFQVTFFRSATGLAATLPSRFAPRQLLFAHAAVTDLSAGRHRHDQRIVRWNGDPAAPIARASTSDTAVVIGRWSLVRDDSPSGSRYQARFDLGGERTAWQLTLRASGPPLLQGEAGYSRKGPLDEQASHYVSEPQLAVTAAPPGETAARSGRAWLDHEWSDTLLAADAVGWDWIGINLFDGSALTAFRLRRRDGSALWAGGSVRRPDGTQRAFGEHEVRFSPGRSWRSPSSGAVYPVQWTVEVPAGRYTLRALLDAQEVDSRASTGALYWEGLSELLDAGGRRIGLGYLEMTGYAGVLRLG